MRKISGQSTIEYVVPTIIIGSIIGVAAYNFLTSGNILDFIGASIDWESRSGTEAVMSPYDNKHRLMPGELSGSQGDPKINCEVDNCSVDMGDYIINNVPVDFQDYVQLNKLSDGTKKLSDLLYLLAQTANVDPATKQTMLNLYDKSQNIIDTQLALEEKTQDLIDASYTGPMDPDFENLALELNSGLDKTDFTTLLADLNSALGASVDQDDINTLAMINLLSTELLALNDSMYQQADLTISSGTIDYTNPDFVALKNPPYSFHDPVLDLDKAIVCNTGDGSETGYTCP